MKLTVAGWLVMGMLGVASSHAQILIDYEDLADPSGHDVAVRNGGFETITAGANAPYAIFSKVPFWDNVTDSQSDVQSVKRGTVPSNGGLLAGVINNLTGENQRAHGQRFDVVLFPGDQVDVSFMWKKGWRWPNNGLVCVELFYTDDNDLFGARHLIATLKSRAGSLASSWVTERFDPVVVPDTIPAGRQLMMRFRSENKGSREGFAFIDNVYVRLNPTKRVSLVALTD